MKYLIRYEYPGQVARGQEPMRPVGLVYVREAFPMNGTCFSYTKDPKKATTWPTIEEAERQACRWEAEDAVVLAEEVAGQL